MKVRLAMTTFSGCLLLLAAPVYAQTGYPPGPGTTQPAPVNATQDLGALAVGETVTRELCGFGPNSTVRITVNDSFVTNKTADGNGCVSVQLKVASATSVQVDGITASARCGTNQLVGAGTQADGTAVSQTLAFEIACGNRASTSGTASTGANIARGGMAGAALVATGALLMVGSRRRRASDQA